MVVPPELDVVPLDPDEDEDEDDDDDDDVLPEDEDEELLLAVPFDPLDPLEPLEPEDDGVGASTFVSGLSPGSVGLVDVAVPPEGGGAEPVPPYGPPSGGSLLPLQPVMAATAIALVSAKRESDARVVVVHIMASYLRVRRAGLRIEKRALRSAFGSVFFTTSTGGRSMRPKRDVRGLKTVLKL